MQAMCMYLSESPQSQYGDNNTESTHEEGSSSSNQQKWTLQWFITSQLAPTQQILFYAVPNHKYLISIKAKWNCFKTGHGMGPCDGIDESVNIMIEHASKHGTPRSDMDEFF